MKTKDLIKLLQEADPSGENEVCVGNADIHFVDTEVAYWDGCLQVLERDPARAPYYDICGARYVGEGLKVVIHPLSISSAIFNDEDLPVEFVGMSEQQLERYKKMVEDRRAETRKIHDDVEGESFVEHMRERFLDQDGEDFRRKEVEEAAKKFYAENLSYLDEMPEDIKHEKKQQIISGKEYTVTPSWRDRRWKQWRREIAAAFEDGKLVLKKVNYEHTLSGDHIS